MGIVQFLLSDRANPNLLGGRERYPVLYAIGHCSPVVVSWLIDAGADINATVEGANPVFVAVTRERLGQQVFGASHGCRGPS